MNKKLLVFVTTIILIIMLAPIASAAARYGGSGGDLVERTESFGSWLQRDLFGTLGLFGVIIGGVLVMFGNTSGLKRIGLVVVVLCIVAAYQEIWDTLLGFFGG